MFHAPATESKQQSPLNRTPILAPQGQEISPFVPVVPGCSWSGAAAGGTPPSSHVNSVQRRIERLHRTYGNQAVLRVLAGSRAADPSSDQRSSASGPSWTQPCRTGMHSSLAIQRETDPTAISVTGEELPDLGATPDEGGNENVENPDLALSQIEQGAPFGTTGTDAASGQTIAGQPPDEEKGTVQTAANGSGTPGSIAPGRVLARLGPGQPLAQLLRADMESSFGSDFSGVRVHNDQTAGALAGSLGAHAFTVGEHVAFAPGLYQPETAGTRRLVAHELTHVVQQRRGLSGEILRYGIGQAGDSYEQEAEQTANRICGSAASVLPMAEPAPVAAPISSAALQCYSGSDAASYAKSWALKTNPAYLRFEDDCTNFVSQAMEAGGWTYLFGSDTCDDRKKNSVWWFKKDACWRPIISNIHASHTWGGAHNFYNFVKTSGRGTKVANVYELEPGDVLQRDHGDGTMHHSMVVTDKGTDTVDGTDIKQIWVSYHTNDTLDRKFWGSGGFDETTKSGWKYYGWKIT